MFIIMFKIIFVAGVIASIISGIVFRWEDKVVTVCSVNMLDVQRAFFAILAISRSRDIPAEDAETCCENAELFFSKFYNETYKTKNMIKMFFGIEPEHIKMLNILKEYHWSDAAIVAVLAKFDSEK